MASNAARYRPSNDALFSDYLAALAEMFRPEPAGLSPKESNDRCGELHNKVSELFDQMVNTSSPLARHIELKFQALLSEIDDDGLHRIYRAMLESIRADVLELN